MSLYSNTLPGFVINKNPICASSQNNSSSFFINSLYVHLTSGKAYSIVFEAPASGPITELYVHRNQIAFSVSASNVSIRCTVRNVGNFISGTNKLQPGNTVYATSSSSDMPYTLNEFYKWIKISFNQPYNCEKGQMIYLLLDNNSVNPTQNSVDTVYFERKGIFNTDYQSYITTTGFATDAGTTSVVIPYVVKIGSNYFGMPFNKLQFGVSDNYSYFTGITPTNATDFDGARFGMQISEYSKNYLWTEIVSEYLNNLYVSNNERVVCGVYNKNTLPTSPPDLIYLNGVSTFDTTAAINANNIYLGSSPKGEGPFYLVFYLTSSTISGNAKLIFRNYTHLIIADYNRYPSVFDSLYDMWNICPYVYSTGTSWVVRKDILPTTSLVIAPIDSSNSVVANIGELELLDKMLKDSLTTDEDYILKLYNNNVTPSSSSVVADFTEATFTNYVAKTLTRSSWSSATTDSLGQAQSSYAKQSWTCGTVGDTIYGYYVIGATSGVLLWAEKFTVARVLSDLNGLEITPKITLNNQY